MRESRCCWRLVLPRLLCCVVAFSIILLSTSIGVNASSSRVFDFTWTPQAQTSIIGHNFNTIAKDMGTVVLAQSGQVERDKYYEVTLRTELTLDSTQQAINYRIPYVALGDYIVHLGNNVNDSSSYQEYSLKTICLTGAQMLDGLPSSTRMYVFHKDGLNLYGVANVTIDLVSIEEITSSDSGSFNDGYEQGFEDGENQGYNDGYSDGYVDGEDEGYNQGFEDGKDSVDIDSIYMDGYNAGSETAYVQGYDEGYLKGYAEALALNGSNSTSMKAGTKKTYSISKQILSTDLTHYDFDRFYPIFHNVNGFIDEIYHLEGYLDDTTFDIYGDSYLWQNANYTGYKRFDSFKVFTTSPDVYAYSVRLKHNVGSYALRNGIEDVFLLFGTENDILNGDSFRTRSLSSEQFESVFWYLNDGSINDLYLAPLVQFNIDCESGAFSDAMISVWFSANFEVTPYTKEEYSAAASAIEKQTLELKKQTAEMEEQTEEMKEQTETQKGMLSKMSDFFGSFFDNLINSVIGLFVPSTEELGELFQRFDDFFAEKFGFLYYPIDVLTDFVALMTTETSDVVITFPSFSIMGYEVWESVEFDMSEIELINEIASYVRVGTSVAIVVAFLGYVDKKFNLITRG